MIIEEFLDSIISLLNWCAVYYVTQLLKCVQISFLVFLCVFLLRRILPENKVFVKGALWALFIPVLFAGRMKFYYENTIGILLFSWWTESCKVHVWVNWLYLCGVFCYAALLFHKKRKLKRYVLGMEKKYIEGVCIYMTDMPVTPSAIGLLRPKIVMPKIMLTSYTQTEIQTILLHEKTHIRLGHLLYYFLWDILRVLLWINPLFIIGTKLFREDMEEICDLVTIHNSKGEAYDYGKLLLKSMRILQEENEGFGMFAAFAGEEEYKHIRQRIMRIVKYRPYKRTAAAGIWTAAVLCTVIAAAWLKANSYDRCNENDVVITYGYNGEKVTFFDTGGTLSQMISYDSHYLYVDKNAFEQYLKERHLKEIHAQGDIFIVFGGFYKLPGIGGIAYSCCYEPDCGEDIAKIPYDSPMDSWQVKLLKML